MAGGAESCSSSAQVCRSPQNVEISEDGLMSANADLLSKGYSVIRKVFSPACCETLKARASAIVKAFDPKSSGACVFETDRNSQGSSSYFRASGSAVCCFLEDAAVGAGGELLLPKELAVNKIGHALHDKDEVFRDFSYSTCSAVLLPLARLRGYTRPSIVQSTYIFKHPGIGGAVNPHQDSSFIGTTPESCLAMWVAMEEATVDNGCLYVIPNSHKFPIHQRFIYLDEKKELLGFDRDMNPDQWDIASAIPIEAGPGDVVFMHGQLVHFSKQNCSNVSRQALTLHIVETNNCTWNHNNWLLRPQETPFTCLYDDSTHS
eukprot:GHVT01071828.1.p1 GENE.GHVT01071828.1~~GHVT01071828.1.p1  ORF type:complete len:319 (+),score=18.47 GHVT01071828.1:542-1498(+)